MLIAAFLSLSWVVPQSAHFHILSRRFNASFTVPQAEQVLLEGYHLSMKVILTPFWEAIYTNFLTKSAKPKSLTLRPQRDFMPCRFKSSSRVSSYRSVSSCASFQWKSARCRSILRCLRVKSSLARSRFFDLFLVRECLRLTLRLPLSRATQNVILQPYWGDCANSHKTQ